MQANKYFQVKELVSSKIYNQYGDDAIKFLDPKALEALENVREILNVPLICNNWATGGSRNYSGYREPGCGVGTPTGYHYKGQAFDLISTKLTAKEMREILENNQDKLKYPIRVEKWDNKGELSWLHIDIGNTKGNKIYFRPGDLVTLKHDIPNKPTMLVIKKEVGLYTDKMAAYAVNTVHSGSLNNNEQFKGMRCIWFTNTQELQEKVFNTKDLIKV